MPWVEPEPTGTTTPEQLAGWEEVYGPDYPLSPGDIPVIQNSHVRVIYDNTNTPGFKLFAWNGTIWVEQGKVNFYRIGDSSGFDQALLNASVLEWAPHRAAIEAIFTAGGDRYSRERVIVTIQRGWTGPRFEVYAANKADGTDADVAIYFTPAQADTNDAAVKIDSGGAQSVSTAGSGGSLFTAGNIGAGTFTGENELVLLREAGTFQVNMAVLQPGLSAQAGTGNTAYGGAIRNTVSVRSSGGAGYASVHFGFCAQQADQILEAEAMTLGTGTNNTTDAAASGGHAATATRTTDANAHATRGAWPNGQQAKYRVLARVKVSANSASFYAKTGGTTGATVTGVNSTSYVWVDLGDIAATNSTLEIHAWMSGGAGTVSVDRIAAIKLEDRTSSTPSYDGARDHGQGVLYDLRPQPRLIARQ